MLVESLPEEHQNQLPFIDNRPGKKFLNNFKERHREVIRFGRCAKEEDIRWKACNADTLTTHFLEISKIINEHHLDSSRIANLDETGMSPNKDCLQSDRRKSYITRSTRALQRSPQFKNIDRVTMMPVIFASGCVGRPLFVVKGKSLKFRVIETEGCERVETLLDYLPSGSVITCREDVAGVGSANFFEWAKCFAKDCAELTKGNRKVLLILDGYRSHMGFKVLHMLHESNIIVYALPSHTSGVTQPLDVGVFVPFKEQLRNLVEGISNPGCENIYDSFDYLKLVHIAYQKAFKRSTVCAAFSKAGLFPLHWKSLISAPCPASAAEPNKLITVEDITAMTNAKRELQRKEIGLQPVVLHSGYLDTTAGLCLTSTLALRKAELKDAQECAKRAEQRRREAEKAKRDALLRSSKKRERLRWASVALARRVSLYGVSNVPTGSMPERRKAVKLMIASRKAAAAVEKATDCDRRNAALAEM